jgi:hypothetical protein
MAARKDRDAATSPGFFDGRYLIEIESWDWDFFLGAPSVLPTGPAPKLIDARAITINGCILAPKSNNGRRIQLFLTPIRADYVLRDHPPRIGDLLASSEPDGKSDLQGQACIPEETLGPVLQGLGSIWRYAHLWVSDSSALPCPIRCMSFTRDLPAVVRDWLSEN